MGCKLIKPKKEPAHGTNAASSGQITATMVQNVLLIWLDQNINDTSADCRNTISKLRCTVNTIKTFTDDEQCVHFLENMNNEKACMIISGAFGQHIVPRIHTMPQVDSIFIFCSNIEYHEQWTKDWSKVKGVFTEINPICDALKQAAQQCEQNAISISIIGSDEDVSKKTLNQLEPNFMYSQIMKEILLTIDFEQKHFQEFITYCRNALTDNEGQLKHVDKLEQKYRDQTPIWWYTLECFLYPMLNRALRLMDTDLMIQLGFFINDLHRQIEQLHKKQFDDPKSKTSFTVYRGQGMDKAQFEKTVANKGGLLSFNCFLSTSRDRTVSSKFAKRAAKNPDLFGVLFVITIDPAQSTTPFASIIDVSSFGSREDEALFSMHTVFRIGTISPMDESHRFFQVELTLTNDNDIDFRQLTDRIREETFPDSTGWYRLGLVLWKMGQAEKAQRVYETLLKQETEESAKAPIYHQLGMMQAELGGYEEAIGFFEKSIAIVQQILPSNHPSLAASYLGIGTMYGNMGDYPKALESYEKVLGIQQQSLPPNHPDVAMCYNNIGTACQKMGDYPKAFSSYEKALGIRQQSLPPNHPHLAMSYYNIGSVYGAMGDYPKALSSFEKVLAIQQQSLPPNHPDLARSYNDIGEVYRIMGDYPKALSSYEKALAITQESLPPNHPHLGGCYNSIGSVYDDMGDYLRALSFYEKALEIRQKSLPSNHPDLAMSYNNIGVLYDNMNDYPKALSSYEKALAIRQQSLSPNHPDLAMSYNNIGTVYASMDDYPKALSSCIKALVIQQQSLPPNHPDLGSTYNNIGTACDGLGDYPKALSFYEKTLAIKQQSLPPNHPELSIAHFNMGLLYEKMGDSSKACSSYERAVEIGQKSLPSNHPHLLLYRRKLADIK